jgi:hypothetical protein
MNKETRQRLLYFSIIGFLITAGGFLFYALGWSFNQTPTGGFTFKKTGAILLKTRPGDALIKINNQPYARKHNLFGNNGRELISGLLPGDYQIEISKDGFGAWRKKLTVTAGLISSATKIVLLPEKIPTEPVAKAEVEKFWFTTQKKEEAINLFYSLKQKQLKMPGSIIIAQILNFPFDTNKIIIASQKAVYLLDRENFSLEILANISVKNLTINDSEIAFFDQENNLQIYNLDSRQITNKIPLELPEKIIKIAFSKSNTRIAFLDDRDNLFIYERSLKELKSIAEKIKDFRFSPDSKKIAVLTETGKIEIIFLENYHQDFTMATGEKIELNLNITMFNIVNFDWLPQIPDYLVINYSDKMIIAETDPRPPLNWWLLTKNVSNFSFDTKNNLYLFQNDKFMEVQLQ